MPRAKSALLLPTVVVAVGAALSFAVGCAGLSTVAGISPDAVPWLRAGLAGLLAAGIATGWVASYMIACRHRAAAEHALLTRSRLIVDAAADAILTLDHQGRIESYNASANRMFGYAPGEVLGRDISLLIGTADKSDVEFLLQEAVQTGGARVLPESTAFVGKHKDGHTFPVELGLSKVIDEDRRIYVQIIRDLTERKRASKHRRIQYEAARVLAGASDVSEGGAKVLEVIGKSMHWPVGVLWTVRPDGLLRCAAAWVKEEKGHDFIGRVREEAHAPGAAMAGRVWQRHEMRWVARVGSEADSPAAATAIQAGYHSAIGWPVELEGHTLGVLEFRAESIRAPDDALVGCLFPVATQLAQFLKRRADEEALRHAKDVAESASLAKSEFLGNISHEIRTPLNGILGLTEIVLSGSIGGQDREHLELVQSSAATLLSLVNDLLDFSKIEAARMELDAVPFAIRVSLAPALRSLEARAHKKGLGFSYGMDPEVPAWLLGDPLRLQQVLYNLVGNAIKFTEQGEVAVRIALAARTNREAVLHGTVRDTGIGIAHDKQEAIFEAFRQADGSRSRRHGGTGLGLTIASRLVGMMGGRIWVESQPGQGSTFHFTACLASAGEAALSEPEAGTGAADESAWTLTLPPAAILGKRILVAEDNPVNCILLDLILQKRQHRVTFAGTGHDVVRLWGEQPFDLVIMDVQLPEMDGLEATRRILEEAGRANRTALIVGLTAHASDEDRTRCLESGMAAYLAKPVKPGKLLDVIDGLLRAAEQ